VAQQVNLPFDVVAETGVIGTLLSNPRFVLHSEFLKPKHFYEYENGCIYWAINELYKQGVSEVDDFSIIAQIESNEQVKKIFEKKNINDIKDFLNKAKYVARPTKEEYLKLCKRILNLSFKRDMYNKLENFQQQCLSIDDTSANEINMNINNSLGELAKNYIIDDNVKLFGEVVDEVWEEIVESRNESGFAGIPSKFPILNEFFTYEDGELVLISGREKTGKSMYFINETIHKIENGVPTAYFDTEMSDKRFLERALAYLTGIKIQNIRNGKYTSEDYHKIKDALNWIKKQKFVHYYEPAWTFDKIYIMSRILKNQMGLGFLVFDYIKQTDTNTDMKEADYLGEMCNLLKNNVGGALNIPVLAGGQQSPYDMRLADSAKLARYASVIAYWMYKEQEEINNDGADGGNMKLIIDRNRLGRQMREGEYINFRFRGDYARIEQAKYQPLEEKPDFMK
jgi:replicative DNA helicase